MTLHRKSDRIRCDRERQEAERERAERQAHHTSQLQALVLWGLSAGADPEDVAGELCTGVASLLCRVARARGVQAPKPRGRGGCSAIGGSNCNCDPDPTEASAYAYELIGQWALAAGADPGDVVDELDTDAERTLWAAAIEHGWGGQ